MASRSKKPTPPENKIAAGPSESKAPADAEAPVTPVIPPAAPDAQPLEQTTPTPAFASGFLRKES